LSAYACAILNALDASQAALEETFKKFMLSMDHLNSNALSIITWLVRFLGCNTFVNILARISDSNSCIINSVSTHSVQALAHLGIDGRPLSAILQEHAQHIQ